MTDEEWKKWGEENGWKMPCAPCWKRLPMIRHARALWNGYQVERHNQLWRSLGAIPTGYDNWIIGGIWRGLERENHD